MIKNIEYYANEIEKCKQKINELEKMLKIEELERMITKKNEQNEEYVLRLRVDNEGDLNIGFNVKKDNLWESIGFISKDGKCYILNENHIENYYLWRAKGMKTSDEIVEWRGGKYRIRDYRLERIDIPDGLIYDFLDCSSIPFCRDTNIIRFKHNNRPIIF